MKLQGKKGGRLILVTGGARSGKSKFAEVVADKLCASVTYVATMERLDEETKERIREHKKRRSPKWKTIEEGRNLVGVLRKIESGSTVILDCLTLYISNLMQIPQMTEKKILQSIHLIVSTIHKKNLNVIIVTNEVGMGIVPVTKLGRDFRDTAGRVNQIVGKESDEVYFVICGVPLAIKNR